MIRYIFLFFALIPSFSVLAVPSMKADYAIVMDALTGQVLYEKNANTPVAPSSMSKLMTGYLLLEALKKGDVLETTAFKVSKQAAFKEGSGESAMYLTEGTKVSVIDLFKGMMIMSAGDACRVVAEGLSGDIPNFVAKMNAKAKEMGLRQSHFSNPSGAAEDTHLMSVFDVAVLSRRFWMDFPTYYPILKEKFFDYTGYTPDQKKEYEFAMWNRNRLLWFYRGADGLKTGHTDKGGYALAASAKRGDRRLIAVINGLRLQMGRDAANRERAREAAKLLDYGFEAFEQKLLFKTDEKMIELPVWFGRKSLISAGTLKPIYITYEKETQPILEVKVSSRSPVKSPIQKGDTLGTISVFKDGRLVSSLPLVALEDVKRLRFGFRLFRNLSYFIEKIFN